MANPTPIAPPAQPSAQSRQYDIIIPVYNGFHFFRECYLSVKQHTAPRHTILVVDDGSSEKALQEYFDQIETDPTTIVLHLPSNRGFVHAVNQGISQSQNDIVLLNSDTVVTPGWLEKLDTALYHAPHIATATPWTNKGTICSLPQFCQDNELPPNMTADELNEIAATVSPGRYPHLPTAVGFCTAIRRQVINTVGLFDEEAFGRGYCEENDFSMRAREAGYVNILDDRTFIHHKGSMTFAGAKEQILAANLKKLSARHPRYLEQVYDFIDRDPLAPLRNRINRLIEDRTGKIHLLFLLHNDPTGDWAINPGGTEYHVLDLAESLFAKGQIVPFILASSGRELLLLEKNAAGGWLRSQIALENRIDLTTTFDIFYRDRLLEILDLHHIEILHIHQLINSPTNIPALLADWRGTLFFTLHDFYTICPNYNLLTPQNIFCQLAQPDQCPSCTMAQQGFRVNLPDDWHRRHAANLQRAATIYVPSENCRHWLTQVYPDLTASLVVRGHGIQRSNQQSKRLRGLGQRLRIGFLGGLSKVKGSALISNLIALDAEREIDWLIIGEIGDPELICLEQENVFKTGRYQKQAIATLLTGAELDLVILCSIWPETFSYTLSECWAVGLPVLVGPLGAPADRVHQDGGGLVTKELTAQSYWDSIKIILTTPEEFSRLATEVRNIKMMTVEEMAALYQDDYATAAAHNSLPRFRPNPSRPFWLGISHASPRKEKEDLLTQLIAERNRHMAEGERYHTEYERLLRTMSWRLTAPLRAIMEFFKKIRNQLA